MSPEARRALEPARRKSTSIGDTPLLPSPTDPSRCASRHLARDWWKKGAARAKLEPRPGRGWHSLRRKFASDLKTIPLKTLCELGGWKNHQTVLVCYQHSDQVEMREALAARARSHASG